MTAGTSGTALLAFGQSLPEPYKTWATYCSPFAAATVQALWPKVQIGLTWVLLEAGGMIKARWARWKIDSALKDLEALNARRNLDPELKASVQKKISVLRQARIDVTMERVKEHYSGNST